MSFAKAKESCIPPRSRGNPWVYWSYPNRSLKDSPKVDILVLRAPSMKPWAAKLIPNLQHRLRLRCCYLSSWPQLQILSFWAATIYAVSASGIARAAGRLELGISVQRVWQQTGRQNFWQNQSSNVFSGVTIFCVRSRDYIQGEYVSGLGSGDTICVSGVCLDLG